MGKLFNVAIGIGSLIFAYELGREHGARKMFFTCMEAFMEFKEGMNATNDSNGQV